MYTWERERGRHLVITGGELLEKLQEAICDSVFPAHFGWNNFCCAVAFQKGAYPWDLSRRTDARVCRTNKGGEGEKRGDLLDSWYAPHVVSIFLDYTRESLATRLCEKCKSKCCLPCSCFSSHLITLSHTLQPCVCVRTDLLYVYALMTSTGLLIKHSRFSLRVIDGLIITSGR